MTERPNIRNLFGILALIIGLIAYGLIVAELSVQIGSLPFIVEVMFYIVAGLIWLWPARALVRWMMAGNIRS